MGRARRSARRSRSIGTDSARSTKAGARYLDGANERHACSRIRHTSARSRWRSSIGRGPDSLRGDAQEHRARVFERTNVELVVLARAKPLDLALHPGELHPRQDELGRRASRRVAGGVHRANVRLRAGDSTGRARNETDPISLQARASAVCASLASLLSARPCSRAKYSDEAREDRSQPARDARRDRAHRERVARRDAGRAEQVCGESRARATARQARRSDPRARRTEAHRTRRPRRVCGHLHRRRPRLHGGHAGLAHDDALAPHRALARQAPPSVCHGPTRSPCRAMRRASRRSPGNA